MKRFLMLFLSLVLILLQPASVNALSAKQKAAIDSGAREFNVEQSNVCGPGSNRLAGTSIFVSGDSLTVGMRDSGGLQGKLSAQGWKVNGIQAMNGETTSGALGKLTAKADTYVMALGTNTENNFQQAVTNTMTKINELSPGANVYWVNMYAANNNYQAANSTLSSLAGSLGFEVVDWRAEATSNPTAYPFEGDGLHHTAAGYAAKADFVVRSVGGAGPVGQEATEVQGGDNISIIFNYLVGKGLEDYHAAGILGNMHHESAYQPQRLQGTKSGTVTPAADVPRGQSAKAWGLVQWDPAHKMIDPATKAGKDPNSITTQLDYLWAQLNNQWPEGWAGSPPSSGFNEKRAGDQLKAATTVADATIAFETKYERHAGPPQPSRITEAEKILEMARTGKIDVTAVAASSACNGGGGGGDITAKVLAYAWPDYRGNGFTTAKPEYAEAVKVARSEGRYVGSNGIDCGGFVTTLMLDSGFEPRYNSNGRGGNTVSQKSWASKNWQKITVASSADLQPGDVAFTPGHTFMYVGQIPGFQSEIASASYNSRAPMAGKEGILKDHNGSPVEWYRKP